MNKLVIIFGAVLSLLFVVTSAQKKKKNIVEKFLDELCEKCSYCTTDPDCNGCSKCSQCTSRSAVNSKYNS